MKIARSHQPFNFIIVPENDMEENLIKEMCGHTIQHGTPDNRCCAVVKEYTDNILEQNKKNLSGTYYNPLPSNEER